MQLDLRQHHQRRENFEVVLVKLLEVEFLAVVGSVKGIGYEGAVVKHREDFSLNDWMLLGECVVASSANMRFHEGGQLLIDLLSLELFL